MNEIIKSLNNKIVINDLIVRRMKYEINMLFYDKPSKKRALELAKKNQRANRQFSGRCPRRRQGKYPQTPYIKFIYGYS